MARQRTRKSPLTHTVSQEAVRDAAAIHDQHVNDTSQEFAAHGLKLSAIQYVSVDELKPSEYNRVFDQLKSKPYWQNLRDDMESAGTITDPLLVTKNRVILAGHSRTEIARSLRDSGDSRFEEVPVRFILSPLRDEDLKRRVCLSNLNRFEIDVDTRVILRAEIYPEYYAEVEHTAGRPRKLTEASEQDSGRSITPKQIAEMNATTMRTIQKERELYQTAKKIAADNNRDQPAVEDVKAARKSKNRTRRSSSTSISSHVKKLIRDALAQYEQTETNQANRDAVRSFVVSVLGDE